MNIPHFFRTAWVFNREKRAFAERGDRPLAHGQVKTGIVLSLTSIRPRLETMHLPVYRVLREGFTPDFIEVWLDESLQSAMTPEMRWLEAHGVRFNWVQDVGPHTKLVYAMQRHPRASIITIDDDILLPLGSCETLVRAAKTHSDAVICNRARRIPVSAGRVSHDYSTWRGMSAASESPSMNLLPLGYGSVLYPPEALAEGYFDVPLFKQLCPTGDDLWFTAMRILRGRRAFNTGYFKGKEIGIPGSEKHCIKNRNKGIRGNNNDSIERLFVTLGLDERLAGAGSGVD